MPPKKTMFNQTEEVKKQGNNRFSQSIFGAKEESIAIEEKTMNQTKRLRTRDLPLSSIRFYARNDYEITDTAELEKSIHFVGLLNPICVLTQTDENGDTYYEAVAGGRRLTAVQNLYKKALEENNKGDIEWFSKIRATIIPTGATDEEIQEVLHSTNFLQRQLSVLELFKHLDYMFKMDENGHYIELPEGRINKAKIIYDKLKSMGFHNYKLGILKKYSAIWTANDIRLREEFKKGYYSLNNAYVIAQMPNGLQTEMLDKFSKMTEKEIREYLKTYQLQTKAEKQNKNRRSVDVLNDLSKLKLKIQPLSYVENIDITNKEDKFALTKSIDELIQMLKDVKSKYK